MKTIKKEFTVNGNTSSLVSTKPSKRKAQCVYCSNTSPSDPELPFFKKTDHSLDTYYCGCRGWG